MTPAAMTAKLAIAPFPAAPVLLALVEAAAATPRPEAALAADPVAREVEAPDTEDAAVVVAAAGLAEL
jgi:hypothetical protein